MHQKRVLTRIFRKSGASTSLGFRHAARMLRKRLNTDKKFLNGPSRSHFSQNRGEVGHPA